jgi:hypothetical protein
MSLAEETEPAVCLDICQETIAKNLIDMTASLPKPNDDPAELAKKYTIVGARLRTMREYLKEAQKAVQIGSDSVAFLLQEQSKHKPLSEFADTEIEISVGDGEPVKTTFEKFEKVAQKIGGDN